MHIHILGICGTFMAGIASLAKAEGFKVTGCDQNVYPPMSTQLAEQGIDIIEGFDASQTGLNPDIYIIGNVIARGNALMESILNQNLPYLSGPQWLYEHVLHDKWVLAVAGTHGKTTTTAMLAWILESNGLAPGYLIGGVPGNFNSSAKLPDNTLKNAPSFFVIEADEYDTAFFDKRSKFVHYHPRTLILNNLEFDHADIFDNLEHIKKHVHHLVRTIPEHGRIICNAESQALQETISMGLWSEIEYFSDDKEWSYQWQEDKQSIEILHQTKKQGTLVWGLIGHHNASNALAAIAAARHVGVSPEQSIQALSSFKGVKKRMEKIAELKNRVLIYDDFAHHPSAIRTTLEGLSHTKKSGRIVAVIEPRSNTMKLGSMKADLLKSLEAADQVYCFTNNLTWDAHKLFKDYPKAMVSDNINDIAQAIVENHRSEDHIVFMSNGNFSGIQSKVIALFQ
jgi:UDP-N-acetylmuramate: L-alanyl-gamma-D-glutamyl-meso-diaminopimelate ligase